MVRFLSLLVLILSFQGEVSFSQDSLLTGRKIIPLPELSFSSDFGVKFAVEALIYDYDDGSVIPFKNHSRYRISYSTIGAFSMLASNDDVNAFKTDNRMNYYANVSRNMSDYFFGDTDQQEYDKARYDTSNYYNYEMIRVDVGGNFRKAFHPTKKNSLEYKVGLSLIYEKPINPSDSKFISSENVDGNDGAFLSLFEIGMLLDKRNSEFRPQQGYYFDASIKYSPLFLSTHQGLYNSIKAYGFIPLVNRFMEITLATRISLQNAIGSKPYWMTPMLGGTGTLRGFIFRRFSSDTALSYSAELRAWFFKIPNTKVELGGQFFVDGGRVFSNKNWDLILTDHKFALGFGGVMSIFTPDFIMKAELGFSDEGTGFYLGTGYSF